MTTLYALARDPDTPPDVLLRMLDHCYSGADAELAFQLLRMEKMK